jgi:hypothetical protein
MPCGAQTREVGLVTLLYITRFLSSSVVFIKTIIIMDLEPLHIPTPHTPTQESTRDQKPQIQTLYYTAGWSITDITLQFPRLTRR